MDLANINKLIPEPKPEPEEDTQPEDPIIEKRKQLRKIRNSPISVKFIDMETKEEKIFPSIYKAAQFLDKCPQTIAHYGKRKGIWNKKYQIITG